MKSRARAVSQSTLIAKQLSICLAAALGFGGDAAYAQSSPISVTSCADDGSAGTLRAIITTLGAADNNAIVDVSNCAQITLGLGEIPVPVSVAIQGPADGTTTIDANRKSRVFHSTSGTTDFNNLTLTNLTVTGGFVEAAGATTAAGGCILGGTVSVQNSVVTNCVVQGGSSGSGFGGGIAADAIDCRASNVSSNTAGGHPGVGGGVFVGHLATIEDCTIQQNFADLGGGVFSGGSDTDGVTFANSTISSNAATSAYGGIYSSSPLIIRNSTIVFNVAPTGAVNEASTDCAGVWGASSITIDSSIIAENSSATAGCDLASAGVITGGHNLVSVDSGGLPGDTIVANPLLTPLANRGGMTPTHGLSLSSPAVDHGSNVDALSTDQRGPGFDRAVGAAADIGAYERQTGDDELFFGGDAGAIPAGGR